MSACSPEWNERVSAWLDGEVERLERVRVEAHLAACPGCATAAAAFGRLREALRRGARAASPRTAARARPGAGRRAAALAAGLVLVAGGLGVSWAARHRSAGLDRALASDAERTHLRSFSRASPCEFESRDPGAVASWLEGAVGFPVSVPELPGATLLGARRCALGGQPAAHLLYRVGERALTVLVPGAGSTASRAAGRLARGAARCTAGPMGEKVCAVPLAQPALAVSELDPPSLLALFDAPDR